MDSDFEEIPDEKAGIKSPRKLLNSMYTTRYIIIKFDPSSHHFSEIKKNIKQIDSKKNNSPQNKKEIILKNKNLKDFNINTGEIFASSIDIDTEIYPKKNCDKIFVKKDTIKENLLARRIKSKDNKNKRNNIININMYKVPNKKKFKNHYNFGFEKKKITNNITKKNQQIIENIIKNKKNNNQFLKKCNSNGKITAIHQKNNFDKNNMEIIINYNTTCNNNKDIIFDKFCNKNYFTKKSMLSDIDDEIFKNSVLVKEGQKYRMINSIKHIKKCKTKGRFDFLSSNSLSPSSSKNDKYNTEYFSNSDDENYYLTNDKDIFLERNEKNNISNKNKNVKKTMNTFNSYYLKNKTNMFKNLLTISYKHRIFSPVKSERHYKIRINKPKKENLLLQSIKLNKFKSSSNSNDKKKHSGYFQKKSNKTKNNKKGTLLFSKITKTNKKLDTSPNINKSHSEKFKKDFNINNFSYNNSNIYYSYSKNNPRKVENQINKLFNIPKKKLQISNKIYDQEIIRENDEYLTIEKVFSLTVIDASKNLNNSKNNNDKEKNKQNRNNVINYISNKSSTNVNSSSSNCNNKKVNRQPSTDAKNEKNFLTCLSNTLSSNNQTGVNNTVSSINSNIIINEKNVTDNAPISTSRTKKSIIIENFFDNSKITNVKHKKEYIDKTSPKINKKQKFFNKNKNSNIVNEKQNMGIIYSSNKDKTRNNFMYRYGNNNKFCTIIQYNKSKNW